MAEDGTIKKFKSGPRSIGPLIARALDPIAKKRGFSGAEIVLRWEFLAGRALAAITRPERVVWPRAGQDESAGTLHLAVRPGALLDVQHAAPQIMERINLMLGWGAIRSLKIRQTPLGWAPVRPTLQRGALAPERVRALDERLVGVEDEGLRASLRALGLAALRPLDKG